MKSKSIFMTFILLVVLLITTISATALYQWTSEANAGITGGTEGYIGYGSNTANQLSNVTNSSYITCSLASTSFEPVALEIEQSTIARIVAGTGTTINIYNRNCEIEQILTLSAAVQSMPNIVNWDDDSELEIVFPIPTGIETWEYQSDSKTFVRQHVYTNASIDSNFISCPLLGKFCIAFDTGATASSTYLIDGTTGDIRHADSHSAGVAGTLISTYSGVANFQITGSDYRIPFCFNGNPAATGGNKAFRCQLYEQNGNAVSNFSMGTLTYDPYRMYDSSAYFAFLGQTNRFFFSGKGFDSPSGIERWMYLARISDTNGAQKFAKLIEITNPNDPGKMISNWAVADWNKDGLNEACFMYNQSGIFVECLDSTFGVLLNVEVTGIMNVNNLVLADFNPNNNLLGFGTYEGIFYYNTATGQVDRWFHSGFTGSATGVPIVYKDGSGITSPILIYGDTSNPFILKSKTIGATCGDGTCDSYENEFSCFTDCSNYTDPDSASTGNDIGASCEHNTDCDSGQCDYGYCVLKSSRMVCLYNRQCISGVCSNGRCTDEGMWARIDASKSQQFGDGQNDNNFVALFLMIGIPICIIVAARGHIAGIIGAGVTYFGLAIFFAIVGWLSPFILVGSLLIGIILLVIVFMATRVSTVR